MLATGILKCLLSNISSIQNFDKQNLKKFILILDKQMDYKRLISKFAIHNTSYL